MRLRELESWPPALTDSQTLRVAPSNALPAKLKRCGVFSVAGQTQPYLSIVVEYQGRAWHAMVQDLPEALLRRIEATLQGHEGEPLTDLGDLVIVDRP
jgi:hypothetical protein